MISAFGIEHGDISKREAYQRRSIMDPVHPQHKQTTFTDPEGKKQNVDRKMKRTVEHLNRKGYKTYASDQGDFAVSRRGHWYKDAYVGFHDPGTTQKGKHPRGKALAAGLPKRFQVESEPPVRAKKTGRFAGYSRGGASVVRFPAGPGRGLVNRHRLRREVSRNDFSKAFKKRLP